MKMVVAVINPHTLSAVEESLGVLGFSISVTDMKVRAGQEEVIEIYRGTKFRVDLLSELQVSVIVNDEDVDQVAASIARAARVSEIAGSKVFALPVEELYGSA